MEKSNVLTIDDLDSIFKEFTEDQKKICKEEEILIRFRRNLVDLRKYKKVTQEELSKRTGLVQQTISKLETGERKSSLLNLIKYLYGLGIDINILFKEVL